MNFQYLKAFFVTVKVNSITKAAKILHLTQPSVSMQIQSLEKDLQVSLLNRSNKGVELTEAGKIVFDYASTILSIQDNIERDLTNLIDNKKQLLVGACKAVGEYALPCSIYVYKESNKDIHINLDINNTSDIFRKLLDRTVNLGIIHGDCNHSKQDELVLELITSGRLLLVTSLPLIKDTISIKELKQIPLIFREEGSGVRQCLLDSLATQNIDLNDLNIIYELNSMEAIKSSVLSGKGISFIPELSIKRELKDGILKRINIDNLEVNTEFYMAYRKDHTLSPHELSFIQFIKSSKRGFC
ncbi:LysR family transcriptional regulator [Alkaliphilus pronyensis]|uniref:LysR family transcriptional regulator n=1 Tax=Alkaliphilus pronyensis TaxID=1482732 RepID=A0A6I0F218_9FIRM|nr:LysR family transcriptional regulator [Alkaliphilus pronyensis]KAB3535322.1 LysR family transcriptional regulator [Alkaliphilus pronyensis]